MHFYVVIVGLDFGSRRIGVAVSDDTGRAAYPLSIIERRSPKHDIQRLADLLGSRKPERLVVGLPLSMDGSEGPMARAARRFAAQLAARFQIPVELFDERLTSFEARSRLVELGQGRRSRVDAVAAAVILEGWLEAKAR